MADGKRASGGAAGGGVAGAGAGAGGAPKIPVATPNIGGPASMVPLDTALAACIGARIRLTTVLQTTLEGTLFTADPLTNLIAITTTPPPPTPASASQSPLPGDYRIIPISKLQSFQLLALAPESSSSSSATTTAVSSSAAQDLGQPGASTGLKKIDWNALRSRERMAVDKELKKERSRGQGVGKEAQDIFDALSRTLPVRWHEQNIIVLDAVIIRPPYGPDDCKASAKDATMLPRVKKVLEMEKRKVVERNNSSRGATPSGASTPGAGGGVAAPVGVAGPNPVVAAAVPTIASPPSSSSSSNPVLSAVPAPAAASVPPPPVPVPIPAVVGPRKGG